MAADRGMRDDDNSVEEGTDSTDGSQSPSKGMCKKNGITHGCHCAGKPCRAGESKRCKTPKDGRVNGVSKNPQNFSIPSLRSRASVTHNNGSLRSEKTSIFQESPGRRRRSLRGSKHGCDERHSPMGPEVSEVASLETQSDSSSSDLTDTNSALVCSQPTDICSNVQSTLLGPISPDTSRSCTPPLSVSSSQSNASCGSLLNCVPAPRDLCNPDVQLMDLGGHGESGKASHTNGNSSSRSSSVSGVNDEQLNIGKCNGALLTDRNSLCSLFPATGSRTAQCTASASTSSCIRFGASSSMVRSNSVNFPLVNRSSSSSSSLSSSSSSNGCNGKPASNEVTCHWTKCSATLHDRDLMDHIRKEHVETQFHRPAKESSESAKYVCLWTGCKVYSKPSSSQTWLERHIISHSGDKPFQCIVDGCGQRFTSQSGFERHVNSHFNVCPPVKSCTSKGKDDTPSKLLKRKKLRRRKSWLIKTEDFFDSRVMETLRHQLVVLSEHTSVEGTPSDSTPNVTFHSSVIARRTECSGKVKVLLRWTPKDINSAPCTPLPAFSLQIRPNLGRFSLSRTAVCLPDAWVLESQMEEMRQQTLPLSSLPRDTVDTLHPSIYARHRYRKHRRK